MEILAQVHSTLASYPLQTVLGLGILYLGAMALSRNKNVWLKLTGKDFALEFKAEDPEK